MTLLESIDLFPMILTLLAFQIGRMAQEKWKKPIFNPTLIGMILVVAVLLATGMNPGGLHRRNGAAVLADDPGNHLPGDSHV